MESYMKMWSEFEAKPACFLQILSLVALRPQVEENYICSIVFILL